MSQIIAIGVFENEIEATLAQHQLELEGIFCTIKKNTVAGFNINPDFFNPKAQYQLYVLENEAQKALEIINNLNINFTNS